MHQDQTAAITHLSRTQLVHRLMEWQLFFLTGEESTGRLSPCDDGLPFDLLADAAHATDDPMLQELAEMVDGLAALHCAALDAIEAAQA